MARLANVIVNVGNGGLNIAADVKEEYGMVVQLPNDMGIEDTPYVWQDIQEAVEIGINADDTPEAYFQIKQFFDHAPRGTRLWCIGVEVPTTATIFDTNVQTQAEKLCNAANGKIAMLGFQSAKKTPSTATYNGINPHALAACVPLNTFAVGRAYLHQPLLCVVEGSHWIMQSGSNISAVPSLTLAAANRVAYTAYFYEEGYGDLGRYMGRKARHSISNNAGRYRNLAVSQAAFYGSDDAALLPFYASGLHEKSYIAARQYPNAGGFFYTDDQTCDVQGSDFKSVPNRMVMDAVHRIAYQVYIQYLLDTVRVDAATGKLPVTVCKGLATAIENQVLAIMGDDISGIRADVNPNQNLLSTEKLRIDVFVTPLAYIREIEISLNFENNFGA